MTAPRSSGCSSSCSSTRTARRPRRSSSTWTPPTIRCTAPRRAGSFTATMAATATCRSTSSAVTICWSPSCGGRTSMPAPARSRRSHGWWARSGHAGRRCGSSCAPTAASPATELMAWAERQPGRLCPRPGPQLPPGGRDRRRARPGQGRGRADRQAGPLLQGLPLPDPRQLEPRAAGRRQGRAAGRQRRRDRAPTRASW